MKATDPEKERSGDQERDPEGVPGQAGKKTLVAQDGREFLLCLFTERSTDMTNMR